MTRPYLRAVKQVATAIEATPDIVQARYGKRRPG
jgi:hypothetical protein